MRTYFKPLHTLILAGALSTLAGYSMAQPAPGTGPSAGPAAHGQSMDMDKHDPAKMQARMTQRLAELKAKLKVTPAQEAAWTTFTDAVKPTPRATPRAASHAELSKLPTPERLDRMRAVRTGHVAAMTTRIDQRADATKTFYAVLSADQKEFFDDQFSRLSGGRDGRRAGPMGCQHE
jgi:protein CpxP